MAHFFSYDNMKHKHRIYSFEVRNELNELLGYRAEVSRSDAKKGGIVEDVTLKKIRHKVFTTERKAIDYAADCMIELKSNNEVAICDIESVKHCYFSNKFGCDKCNAVRE